MNQPKYTYAMLPQKKLLNLMLFYSGPDDTIVAGKALFIMAGRGNRSKQELKQETTAVPACYVPVYLKKSIMPARQSGSPRQQCIGVISAFVDSIDSQIILRIIRESKMNELFSPAGLASQVLFRRKFKIFLWNLKELGKMRAF